MLRVIWPPPKSKPPNNFYYLPQPPFAKAMAVLFCRI